MKLIDSLIWRMKVSGLYLNRGIQMRLNEKYYTRTIYGLAECDGKRINDDYAVIRPWFTENKGEIKKRNRY